MVFWYNENEFMIFNTKKEIQNFLRQNGIFNFEKDRQLIEVVKLVSRIPFGEARTIEEVLKTKKVGTCTGKHLVLQACFDELGIEYQPVVCTFYWEDEKIKYPENLQAILDEGKWEHGHNFVQIKKENGIYIDVDVNYNPELKPYGFRTFPQDWDGQSSFVSVEKIIRRWDNVNIADMKKELIDSLISEIRERRKRFLSELFKWVGSIK